jgi:hypothetical protein
MAAPNLRDPDTVTGKTAGYAVTTSLATTLSNAADSGKVLKVNTVRAANIDGTAAFDVDLTFFRSSTDRHLARTIPVPADATVILVSKDESIYLEEGDALRARASAADAIELTISYEDIS